MKVLNRLQPNSVFKYFEDICNIPHGSYNTKGLSDYCVDFAKEHGLLYTQDELNNVIIYKDATEGYEEYPTLIIQGHLDMVCEKNEDVIHDFIHEPLNLEIDGDFIKAIGTTLGGDDGIAIAMGLAILEDENISHPKLEVVFTTEEEVGMEGAIGLDASKLSGKYLLNLDSEDEGVFTVSCSGGATMLMNIPIGYEHVDGVVCIIKVSGLLGGHSGMDIDKNRGNANKILGIYLSELYNDYGINVLNVSGGLKNNAIPREATATFVIRDEYLLKAYDIVDGITHRLSEEICINEPAFNVAFNQMESDNVLCYDNMTTFNIINIMYEIINGIVAMSKDIDGLVETSLNLGVIEVKNNTIYIQSSLRSSVDESLDRLINNVSNICERIGINCIVESRYPGWKYNPDSRLRNMMTNTYIDMYGNEPKIEAIHAGLECGIFASKITDIDMISTGPNIYDIHTPDERLSISSVQKTWEYVIKTLENMKNL